MVDGGKASLASPAPLAPGRVLMLRLAARCGLAVMRRSGPRVLPATSNTAARVEGQRLLSLPRPSRLTGDIHPLSVVLRPQRLPPFPSRPTMVPTATLPVAGPSRRRLVPVGLLTLVFVGSLWWLQATRSRPEPIPLFDRPPGEDELVITVAQLVGLGQAELSAAQDEYFRSGQHKRDESELGLRLGSPKELRPEGYNQTLSRSLERYFDPPPAWAADVLARLAPFGSPDSTAARPALTRAIYTTSNRIDLPTQFKGWSELNPEWDVRFLDDVALDDWVLSTFPDSDLKLEWELLTEVPGLTVKERKVLKADLFRYLVLLARGGVYTDTDTSAVRAIETWGRNDPLVLTTPLQALLPVLAALPVMAPLDALKATGGSHQAPALIVALESDAPRTGDAWREQTFSRGMQLVQWTLLSTTGHPIMLDASTRALDRLREAREATGQGKESVLDLTGPGYVRSYRCSKDCLLADVAPAHCSLFTDCVFRFLFARYGITPRQLSGHDRPVQVGDVVILPHRAMQADISEGPSNGQDVVWHGFSGRWKEAD